MDHRSQLRETIEQAREDLARAQSRRRLAETWATALQTGESRRARRALLTGVSVGVAAALLLWLFFGSVGGLLASVALFGLVTFGWTHLARKWDGIGQRLASAQEAVTIATVAARQATETIARCERELASPRASLR